MDGIRGERRAIGRRRVEVSGADGGDPYESDGFTSPDRPDPFPGYPNTLPPVYPTS